MKQIGQNTNTTTESFTQTFSVGSTTAVKIVDAVNVEDHHIEVIVTNDGNSDLWVRRRPATADNDKNGRRIPPGETACVVNTAALYIGEISAIFDSGGLRDVMVERL